MRKEVMKMTRKKHSEYEIPVTPHGKHRYERAMKHVENAKKMGKSSDEIHELFKRIMEADPYDIERIPTDKSHARYRSAIIHVNKAKERGALPDEIHSIYKRIMDGTANKHTTQG